jgi:hypothetical protein
LGATYFESGTKFFIIGRDSGGAIKKKSLDELYKVPWTIFADESA